MRAFLDLLETGTIKVGPLVTSVFPVDAALAAYTEVISGGAKRLAVLLHYGAH